MSPEQIETWNTAEIERDLAVLPPPGDDPAIEELRCAIMLARAKPIDRPESGSGK
jgi:hypothetical protein